MQIKFSTTIIFLFSAVAVTVSQNNAASADSIYALLKEQVSSGSLDSPFVSIRMNRTGDSHGRSLTFKNGRYRIIMGVASFRDHTDKSVYEVAHFGAHRFRRNGNLRAIWEYDCGFLKQVNLYRKDGTLRSKRYRVLVITNESKNSGGYGRGIKSIPCGEGKRFRKNGTVRLIKYRRECVR